MEGWAPDQFDCAINRRDRGAASVWAAMKNVQLRQGQSLTWNGS